MAQQQQYEWRDLISTYNISEEEYEFVPLTKLVHYQNNTLPGLNKEQTTRFIGGLWEGLYKNYVLGIQKQDGTVVDPIGSTEPLILVPKTGDHFFILFRTNDGEPVQLMQTIRSLS